MSGTMAKLLSLLLVLLLVFSAAVGCSKNEPTDSSSDNVGETSDSEGKSQDDTGEEDAAQEEPQEIIDMGGRTISMGAWWDLAPVAGTSEGADKAIARTAELEEKWNFKLEYKNIPWEQLHEQIPASVMAGDPILDIAIIEDKFFYPGYVTKGFLYPVSDLEAFDFSEEKWNKDFMKFGTYKDKVYAFSHWITEPRSNIWWNKTIFEREGLPNLYEIQNNKTWTWDKMLEIAKKATKDLDGDGVIDQWGLGGSGIEWAFVYSNGGETIKVGDDGKAVFSLTDPNAIEGLQYFQDIIYSHKVFDVPPEGAQWDYSIQRFQDGKVAIHHGQWWHAPVRFMENMQDDYGMVVFPMGPRADTYISPLAGYNFYVMPVNVDKPEEVAMVFDALTDPFPDDDPEARFEGYVNSARDMETIDTLKMMLSSGMFKKDLLGNFNELQSLSWDFMWQITSGNKTAKVAIEEIAQQAQSILDDAMQEDASN